MSLPELFQRTRQPLDLGGVPVPGSAAAEAADETAAPPPPPIPFLMQHQKVEFWCWAAVASSVSQHYSPASQLTQCVVANAVLGTTQCCFNENACNRMATLEGALTRTGNLPPNGVKGAPATPVELRTQIRDARRVVGCGIRWADTRGHFVVLHGLYLDGNGVVWVTVADPKYGPSEYPYDSFVSRYRETGRWVVSYATKP